MEYYVISFANTHGAMATERQLKKIIRPVIMPTPREISRGCGISIRFNEEDYSAVVTSLSELSLSSDLFQIYAASDGRFTPVVR